MKIVIDIPEEVYKSIQDNDYCGISNSDMYNAVKNGTPLPKGHGRLIDEQQIIDRFKPIERFKYWCVGTDGLFNVLSDAPTIISADKESEE